MGSAEDAHERAFTRAVFPQKREHFTGMQLQVDSAQCLDSGEGLHDPPHLQKGGRLDHKPMAVSSAVRMTAASGSMPVQY